MIHSNELTLQAIIDESNEAEYIGSKGIPVNDDFGPLYIPSTRSGVSVD